jgi:putative tricarboxylic transport membrane protein
LLELFGLEAWGPAITALVIGTALGFACGLIPGIGGRIGVILSMPLAATFDPYPAAILIFALHSVTNTSSSIPNIALGMPTSSSDAATILDGYPLTKMGRGGEALGASLSASAIGGVLGALAFLAAIPIARPLVTSFGAPEILMLAIIGVTMVASLSSEGLLQGLVVTGLGIIVAMIGVDDRTAEPRFTFGLIDLWDGVGLPAIVCGLFVIPEMLTVKRHDDKEAFDRAVSTRIWDVYRGMFVTLRYRAVLLRSSVYGILVGLTPSVGSSVSVWMSYAYAARTTKSEIPFGKGAIAGVIAPEAANNSKEGGAMIPTLFFGIPGSSGMAVIMGALAFVGVSVGPNMLTRDIGLSYAVVATIFLANLLAVPMFFAVVPAIVRLSALRYEAIAPVAICVSVTAALIDAPALATVVQLLIGAAVGIGLKLANWPRAPFVLGFVIAGLAEGSYFVTAEIWGWSALARPMTLFLLVVLIGWLVVSLRRRSPFQIIGPKLVTVVAACSLIAFFALTFVLSLPLQPKSGLGPMAVSVFSAILCTLILIAALRLREPIESEEKMRHVGITGLFIAAAPIVGIAPASFVYITALLRDSGTKLRTAILVGIICCALQLAMLASVFDILIEREIVGRVLWAAFGYQ